MEYRSFSLSAAAVLLIGLEMMMMYSVSADVQCYECTTNNNSTVSYSCKDTFDPQNVPKCNGLACYKNYAGAGDQQIVERGCITTNTTNIENKCDGYQVGSVGWKKCICSDKTLCNSAQPTGVIAMHHYVISVLLTVAVIPYSKMFA
jgi:hypothetical protein